jgi:hypothetical protein
MRTREALGVIRQLLQVHVVPERHAPGVDAERLQASHSVWRGDVEHLKQSARSALSAQARPTRAAASSLSAQKRARERRLVASGARRSRTAVLSDQAGRRNGRDGRTAPQQGAPLDCLSRAANTRQRGRATNATPPVTPQSNAICLSVTPTSNATCPSVAA